MPVLRVESSDDPRIAEYRNVTDRELLARGGLFVAEGRLIVRRLLTSGRLRTRSVLVTGAARNALADVLSDDSPLPIYTVPQAVMNQITGFNLHRGCLAIGERPAALDWRDLSAASRRLVVLERVGDADNVGSIFRSAAAFGVESVLLGPDCVDPLYRKAIRTSMAASLSLPFARIEPWPHALRALQDQGRVTVALTPVAAAPDLREVAARVGQHARVALVLGHEGEGLTRDALDACALHARIPMHADVDSLNVATAAAVALYALAS
jgi:tRNA G18 (ribose-2'-O)-methylase SpoU